MHILTDSDDTNAVEIGVEGGDVFFTDDPVDIDCEVNDTFDHLIRHSATIRLLTRGFIPSLFSTTCRNAVVNIYRDGECLFAGYIEPQTYSQGFNEVFDELELNSVDVIGSWQYGKFKGIGSETSYAAARNSAKQATFLALLSDIFDRSTAEIDIAAGSSVAFLYDGSKAVDNTAANRYTIMSQISVSELLFMGDEEDDVWTEDAVVEEILRYLNLHIVQQGFNFYIFSWESVRGNDTVTWQNIYGGSGGTTARRSVTFTADNVADTGTQISIGEVYNQLSLTCDIEKAEIVIESPLDDDLLTSAFSRKQRYLTEYSADGDGSQAFTAIKAITQGRSTTYDQGNVTQWFIRCLKNEAWRFPATIEGEEVDLQEYFGTGENQQALANWLGENMGAAVMSLGKVDISTKQARTDDSPEASVSMESDLIISVNGGGNFNNGIARATETMYPTAADIKARIPLAVYEGRFSGIFSPVDDTVTNYIVFSGKIVLNPLMPVTAEWSRWMAHINTDYYWHETVYSRENNDGRYYVRQYWRAKNPKDTPASDNTRSEGLIPFSDKGRQWGSYLGTCWNQEDHLSKVPVVACMLVIGGKCLVETGSSGHPSDFTWQTYKERSQCESDDEYYNQCFTLGFNPAVEDYVVGKEYDIQNNIDYTMGLDVEGTAIPIKKSDNVSGDVKFTILGLVNNTLNEALGYTWSVHVPTPFYANPDSNKRILPLLSNVIMSGFEAKIVTDNGMNEILEENDLIYMSDTDEQYVNKKDDITFKITSALTAAEAEAVGVENVVAKSTPLNVATGNGVTAIYDAASGQTAKPEQLYVDAYWQEYHTPRVTMTQCVEDIDGNADIFAHYVHPAISGGFYVIGISRNLMEGTAELNIKAI
ncbi:MAG: hypothetical protein IJS19_09040 [Muribaculaceae bacterium]|nr:hypothetical protein [Muribaculaceae bacterium]